MSLAAYASETNVARNIKLFVTSIQHHKKRKRIRLLNRRVEFTTICLLFLISSSKYCSWRFFLVSTSDVFTSFKVINAFKRQNSWIDPFRERSTSFNVSLPRMVCGFVTATSPYYPLIFLKTLHSGSCTLFFEACRWEHRVVFRPQILRYHDPQHVFTKLFFLSRSAVFNSSKPNSHKINFFWLFVVSVLQYNTLLTTPYRGFSAPIIGLL